MVQTAGLEPATFSLLAKCSYHLSYVCILLHPGGAEAPPIRKRRGKRKKDGDAEFAPASPMIKRVFSIFPLLSGIFKIYFSAISTTQG